MTDASTGRRPAIALAFLAVAMVGLAGCTGSSGVSDDVALYPSDASSQAEANLTTETPPTTATPAGDPTTTVASTSTAEPTPTEPDDGVEGSVESDEYTAVTGNEIDTSGDGVVVSGTLTNPTDARIDDPHIEVLLYDDEGELITNVGAATTEEPPVSPLYEPGERGRFEARFPDVDPDEVASYTVRSSAMDPAEDPANTPAAFAATFDRMSWQDAPLETYLEVTNQEEETVERLDVVVTASDESGTAIAEHTERVTDLGVGETVTFDHVFEVPDNEVDRVEAHVPGEDYGFVQ